MNTYLVHTTQSDERESVGAAYYVMEEPGFVTFKSDDHKQVASYSALRVVSVARSEDETLAVRAEQIAGVLALHNRVHWCPSNLGSDNAVYDSNECPTAHALGMKKDAD